MPKVILIYANCTAPYAKGDLALAGNLARDLIIEIQKAGEDIKVILTSTQDGPQGRLLF